MAVKTVALVAKKGKPEAAALARELRERYPQLEIVAERHLSHALGWQPPESDTAMVERAELVVVLGGDGTLIHAARLVRGREVPILGVNLGSLGFMTEVPVQDFYPTFEQVLAGDFRTEPRMKLTCKLWRQGAVLHEDEVLNDVVISKGALARIADHEVHIDGRHVTIYKSDGVIVATPTGSTAYALSAGGPIVHPLVEALIVAPICSHALTQRPLVVPSTQVIHIALRHEVADIYLTLDGQSGLTLQTGDRIEVTRSKNQVQLIRNPVMDYFAILRQKLHWGER